MAAQLLAGSGPGAAGAQPMQPAVSTHAKEFSQCSLHCLLVLSEPSCWEMRDQHILHRAEGRTSWGEWAWNGYESAQEGCGGATSTGRGCPSTGHETR